MGISEKKKEKMGGVLGGENRRVFSKNRNCKVHRVRFSSLAKRVGECVLGLGRRGSLWVTGEVGQGGLGMMDGAVQGGGWGVGSKKSVFGGGRPTTKVRE